MMGKIVNKISYNTIKKNKTLAEVLSGEESVEEEDEVQEYLNRRISFIELKDYKV